MKAALAGGARIIGEAQRRAAATTLARLRQICARRFVLTDPVQRRDRAMLTLGWAAALRRSELVGLDAGDIAIVHERADGTIPDDGVPVGLVANRRLGSETNQTRKVEMIAAPSASSTLVCPVRAVQWQPPSRVRPVVPLGSPRPPPHPRVRRRLREASRGELGHDPRRLHLPFATRRVRHRDALPWCPRPSHRPPDPPQEPRHARAVLASDRRLGTIGVGARRSTLVVGTDRIAVGSAGDCRYGVEFGFGFFTRALSMNFEPVQLSVISSLLLGQQ